MFFPSLNKMRPQGQGSNFMTKTKPGSEPDFWKLKKQKSRRLCSGRLSVRQQRRKRCRSD
jgi:hypothetical protein